VNRPSRFSAGLAGWLFADLFLVLFITALATAPAVADRAPSPTPTSTPSTTSTLKPSSSGSGPAEKCPTSYDLVPKRITIKGVSHRKLLDGDRATERALLRKLDAAVRDRGLSKQYAGLILAYGVDSNDHRSTAREAARTAGTYIIEHRSKFARATVTEFSYEHASGREFYLDIYFFVKC
jgi:hypothetical protein